jgi:hypothetical protein
MTLNLPHDYVVIYDLYYHKQSNIWSNICHILA